jgi:hypothetical protein
MRKYINAILSISSVLMLFYIIHDQRQQIKQLESSPKQKTLDSLYDELYISNVNLTRYDMALELLIEQDSLAAAKFYNIYTNETE